jgi:hypothetical protein
VPLNFSTSTLEHFKIIISCDSSIEMNEDQKSLYFKNGTLEGVQIKEDATWITLKPLSIADREQAEIRAGAFTRSELGKLLWVESPSDIRKRAMWQNKLSDEEKEALAKYEQYQNRSYCEYVRSALISIDDKEAKFEMINNITPEHERITTITEIVLHLHRMSTLSNLGK